LAAGLHSHREKETPKEQSPNHAAKVGKARDFCEVADFPKTRLISFPTFALLFNSGVRSATPDLFFQKSSDWLLVVGSWFVRRLHPNQFLSNTRQPETRQPETRQPETR
jgi:hypothetical protein